jgi:hypothetical protein
MFVSVQAQMVSPNVIAPSGAWFQNSTFSLSSTIGEATMVQTFSDGTNFLTQGFQQPLSVATGINEALPNANQVLVYPNPSNGNFNAMFNFEKAGTMVFNIFDVLGRVVNKTEIGFGPGILQQNFNLYPLPSGIYMLEALATFNDGTIQKNVIKLTITN